MLKTIELPNGHLFKFGAHMPDKTKPAIRFSRFVNFSETTPPPQRFTWAPPASAALGDILGNDNVGDCTCAAVGHLEDIFQANSGNPWKPFTAEETLWLYSKITGYDPNDPSTDKGADPVDVLNYWRDHGARQDGSGKISGWVQVDADNTDHLITSLWLLESAYICLGLPDAFVQNMPKKSGFVLDDVGPEDPNNGHAIMAYGKGKSGLYIDTWGLLGIMTWAAVKRYCGQGSMGAIYSVLSPDTLNEATEKSPGGLDIDGLRKALAEVRQ